MRAFAWDRLICLLVFVAAIGFWYVGDLAAIPAGLVALLAIAGIVR